MIVLGITGPTGAGKTTVLNVLDEFGTVILDCDAVYHDLTEHCEPMRKELAEWFGDNIFDENGALQRKVLGAIVFEDEFALKELNEITHRYVYQTVMEAIEKAREEGRPAVAIDAIALLESGLGDLCDATVTVTANDELRVRRIMTRDNISEEYARKRVEAQKPSRWFEEHCTYTLRNDGAPSEVEAQARNLFQTMIK